MIEVLLYQHMLARTELPLFSQMSPETMTMSLCGETAYLVCEKQCKSAVDDLWKVFPVFACSHHFPCCRFKWILTETVILGHLGQLMALELARALFALKFLSSHRQDLTMGGGHCGEGILKDRALWSWRMLEQRMDLPLHFFWMYLLSSLSIPSEKYTRVLENKTIQGALRKVHQRAQDSQRSIKDQGIWWCFMMFQCFLKPHMLSRSGACRRIHCKSEPRFCGGDHWSSWLKSSPFFRGVVQAIRALHLLNFKLAVATNSVLARKARDCNTWI